MNKLNLPFLGTGWSFPPEFDRDSGSIEMVSEREDIHESLNILLSTSIGERVMQPLYGCNLEDYMFEPLNSTVIGYIKDRVENSIMIYESRIKIEDLQVTADSSVDLFEGRFTIELTYSIPETNSRFNFVYDYYNNEALRPI